MVAEFHLIALAFEICAHFARLVIQSSNPCQNKSGVIA